MRGVVERLRGLTYRADFVDEADERQLLSFASSLKLEPVTMRGNTSRRTVRHFGLRYDYSSRVLRKGGPIPDELVPVMRQAAEFAALGEGELIEAIVNRYPLGGSVGWHHDAPVYDVIAGVPWARHVLFNSERKRQVSAVFSSNFSIRNQPTLCETTCVTVGSIVSRQRKLNVSRLPFAA